MTTVRPQISLRPAASHPTSLSTSLVRKDMTTRAIAAACMLAASPASIALAQSASSELPPIVVEAKAKKKKASTAAKKQSAPKPQQAAPTQAPSNEPVVDAEASKAPAGANPYANPEAPYKVEKSASGKLTEPLVNTPRTVTAVPKEVIEDTKATSLRDLARETPGLTIGAAEGGNAFGAFYLRGFKVSNDIFVDNIRNPGNIVPEIFSVEQIEIYKGPSGGIAGRGTIGGAINIINKQPELEKSFYEVGTMIGTDETIRTTLDVNQVVTPDFAVRANLMYQAGEVAGRDFADSERWGGLFSATAKPTDNLQITLDYYRYRNDATPDWGVPINPATRVPFTENGLPRDTWFGQKSLDFFKEEADVGTAKIVAKLADGVTLTNRSRVGTNSVDYVASSTGNYTGGPTIPIGHPQRDQTANIYANQTELNIRFDTGSWKHNMVAGVEVSREEFERFTYVLNTVSAGTDVTSLNNPDAGRDTRFIIRKGLTYDATVDTVGVYLSDTIHLNDQWIVNGGVRFDDFERDQVGGIGNAVPGTPQADTNIANNTANVQADLFSWNVGVVYKPISIAGLYAAYATAESPVGSELDSTGPEYNGLSNAIQGLKPQEAQSVEVGTKWELFNKRLLATAALFQTDVEKARTNPFADSPNPLYNDGEYRVRGLELGVAGNITRDWSVFGGFVLLDTEVLRALNPQDVGRGLANIPEKQFSLMSKYRLTDRLTIGGTAIYGDEIYTGHLARNVSNRHTVDWWRFDAMAEYQLTDNLEIALTGLNLTDELYYDAIYQGGNFAFVAPGRAGYLSVKYKY